MALDDATILLTGGSSGIGEAAAIRLARAGSTVYAAARRIDRLEALAPYGVRPLALDLEDAASREAAVERILDETGRIDVLINNAGYGEYGAFEEMPMAAARRQMEVNLFAAAELTRLVLPAMRAHGRGRIINVSSIGAVTYTPFGGWYYASKRALEGLSDAMRLELAPYGIDVVLLRPSFTRTAWNEIARDGLVEGTQASAYASHARGTARMLQTMEHPLLASGPDRVARAIERVVAARRPRPRYLSGRFGRTYVLATQLSPGPLADRIVGAMCRPR